MADEKIKVVYFDDSPIVYRNGKQLDDKEIVDLLYEFFEDCDTLINEKEELLEEFQNYKNLVGETLQKHYNDAFAAKRGWSEDYIERIAEDLGFEIDVELAGRLDFENNI